MFGLGGRAQDREDVLAESGPLRQIDQRSRRRQAAGVAAIARCCRDRARQRVVLAVDLEDLAAHLPGLAQVVGIGALQEPRHLGSRLPCAGSAVESAGATKRPRAEREIAERGRLMWFVRSCVVDRRRARGSSSKSTFSAGRQDTGPGRAVWCGRGPIRTQVHAVSQLRAPFSRLCGVHSPQIDEIRGSTDPSRADGGLTHLDSQGTGAHGGRLRQAGPAVAGARARAVVQLTAEVRQTLLAGELPKGEALGVARLAGIQAAKETSRLIPLCHPLSLSSVEVSLSALGEDRVEIVSDVSCTGPTGVEMEALTAAAVAALTLYDMCKALHRGIAITDVELLHKSGGRSGEWNRSDEGAG